jgi:integrase
MHEQHRKRRHGTGGIRARHSRACSSRRGGKCSCRPRYQAVVYIAREKRRVVKTFPSLAEAKAWSQDAYGAVRRGKLTGPTRLTLKAFAEGWFRKAHAGEITSRSGRPYKDSTLRGYEQSFEDHVEPILGYKRITDISRKDVKEIVAEMRGDGLEASTIHNAINSLRAVYREIVEDEIVAVNPTEDAKLPPIPKRRRERTAGIAEADALLEALPEDLRALYATAFYGGLRRGELRGLRWEDIDLAAGEIHVRRGWDDKVGEIEPKSEKGTRTVPIPDFLARILSEHSLSTGRTQGLVFGRTQELPFTPSHVRRSAEKAWGAHNAKLIEQARPESEHLQPIGLHEARHTYVTYMHHAGVPLERIGDYVGHASSYMTDAYRHLLPDSRERDRKAFDTFVTENGD